jgi:UDPglucose--hexose-1-phosphate uridylyltransferase
MKKNHVRQNKVTKQWTIYSPNRDKRPRDYSHKKDRQQLPDFEANCPFCPGNEEMLPEIILEKKNSAGKKWQTRVVPNKFPVLVPNQSSKRIEEDIYLTMPANGRHEVIIENPKHNMDISQMSKEEIEIVIETYHKRYIEIMKEDQYMIPIIFRNHGKGAGTSLIHPHSQLIVTNFVPRHIRWRELEAQRYYDEWGKCVYCNIISFELKDEQRILSENNTMLAFVPYFAEVPYEIWIIPKKHAADFGTISEKEKKDLSRLLKKMLQKLYDKLDDPDYNYIINTAARYESEEPHVHWHLRIMPKLSTPAGFEIGSGISINSSLPEEDAAYLKK